MQTTSVALIGIVLLALIALGVFLAVRQRAKAEAARRGGPRGESGVAPGGYVTGDASKVIAQHEQELRAARESGDRYRESVASIGLADAYRDAGDARQAIVHYEQALAITREIRTASSSAAQRDEARRVEGALLGDLGLVYSALGDAAQAKACFQQALDISQEGGDRR